MVDTWNFHMKDIRKMPNLFKHFGSKYILIADVGKSISVNSKEQSIRYIKSTREYKNRVNKPVIKIQII